jgi:hypothetical protein
LRAESTQTLRAVVPVCAGIAGGYLCFELFYVAGVAWELHRYPGTNLAGLMEFIVGIPVGLVCGFIILAATWIWMEPQGRRSIIPRSILAVALAVLAAFMSFILINAAYESHYYGKGGGGYGSFIGLMVGLFGGLLVFWLAWRRLKRA